MFLTANGRKWALIFQILVDIGRAQFVAGNGGVDGRGRRIAVIRVYSRPFAVLKLSRHARSKPRTRRWRRTAAPLLRLTLGRNSSVPFTIQRSCRAAVAQLFVRRHRASTNEVHYSIATNSGLLVMAVVHGQEARQVGSVGGQGERFLCERVHLLSFLR